MIAPNTVPQPTLSLHTHLNVLRDRPHLTQHFLIHGDVDVQHVAQAVGLVNPAGEAR